MLKLKKPLVFFDIETTGLNVSTDRIVSIAILKLNVDGSVEKKYRLVNPLMEIPMEAIEVHGISNEEVKDEPTFKQLSKGLHDFIYDCDLGGYNIINYDLPLLSEEFSRGGLDFPSSEVKLVDSGKIFHLKEPRTLVAAYKKYCKKDLDDAHNAQADTNASYEVFLAQIKKYKDIGKTVDEVHAFCMADDNRADLANKIILVEGEYYFNFGTVKGTRVKDDVGFANWMLEKDFTQNTKKIVRHALK